MIGKLYKQCLLLLIQTKLRLLKKLVCFSDTNFWNVSPCEPCSNFDLDWFESASFKVLSFDISQFAPLCTAWSELSPFTFQMGWDWKTQFLIVHASCNRWTVLLLIWTALLCMPVPRDKLERKNLKGKLPKRFDIINFRSIKVFIIFLNSDVVIEAKSLLHENFTIPLLLHINESLKKL